MYGEGGAEEIVADAVTGRRDDVFVVSKVYPHNASRTGVVSACERSLRRLRTDRIDLYLLHWRGDVPLAETVAAFESLLNAGKIVRWGVSNFDVADMAELSRIASSSPCATNQVLYHPGERGIEWQLLPESTAAGMPVMAYSPLGQGMVLRNRALGEIASKHGVTPAAVCIAWTLRDGNIVSIPKTAHVGRVPELVAGAMLRLDADDLMTIDRSFPPPRSAAPLAML
jgi:diketogulonate reductase-like aldo/keto reductase